MNEVLCKGLKTIKHILENILCFILLSILTFCLQNTHIQKQKGDTSIYSFVCIRMYAMIRIL